MDRLKLQCGVENILDFDKGMSGPHKKEAARLLDGGGKANLTVRNFPATVAELRRQLKLSEGGSVYLFATTLADGSRVLLRGEKLT